MEFNNWTNNQECDKHYKKHYEESHITKYMVYGGLALFIFCILRKK